MPTFESSQGTTFTFGSWTGKCMKISVADSAPEPTNESDPKANRVDVSTLDLPHGSDMVYEESPLLEPTVATDDNGDPIVTTKVSITFRVPVGESKPPAGTTDTLTTADAIGEFFCSESTLDRQVGAYLEGSATFVSVTEEAS